MPNRILDGKTKMHRTDVHKPVVGVLMTMLMAFIFYQMGDSKLHDIISSAIIVFCFTLGTLVILVFTEKWTWRATGLMIAIAGAAMTYSFILASLTIHSVEISKLANKSTIRASLDVGGIMLAACIFDWAYHRWKYKHRSEAFVLLPDDETIKDESQEGQAWP